MKKEIYIDMFRSHIKLDREGDVAFFSIESPYDENVDIMAAYDLDYFMEKLDELYLQLYNAQIEERLLKEGK